jgi:hypothetical protein
MAPRDISPLIVAFPAFALIRPEIEEFLGIEACLNDEEIEALNLTTVGGVIEAADLILEFLGVCMGGHSPSAQPARWTQPAR